MEISADIKPINIQQLEAEIRVAFPTQYKGLSTDQTSIRFFVDDNLTKSDVQIIRALYAAHVPSETDDQAVSRKRTAKQELRQILKGFDKSTVKSLADVAPYLEAAFRLLAQDD